MRRLRWLTHLIAARSDLPMTLSALQSMQSEAALDFLIDWDAASFSCGRFIHAVFKIFDTEDIFIPANILYDSSGLDPGMDDDIVDTLTELDVSVDISFG